MDVYFILRLNVEVQRRREASAAPVVTPVMPLRSRTPRRNCHGLLLLARIVRRIDEGDASWSSELNLHDRLLVRCPNIVDMLCGQRE